MVTTATRFAPKTLEGLVVLLLTRRASVAHCVEALRDEATDALSRRDISDLLDEDGPSTDSDAETVLMLVKQSEQRLREVDAALDRVATGTYGYCISCGSGIPLERLRALPASVRCMDCSARSSLRIGDLIERDHLKSSQVRGRSPDGCGASVAEGAR